MEGTLQGTIYVGKKKRWNLERRIHEDGTTDDSPSDARRGRSVLLLQERVRWLLRCATHAPRESEGVTIKVIGLGRRRRMDMTSCQWRLSPALSLNRTLTMSKTDRDFADEQKHSPSEAQGSLRQEWKSRPAKRSKKQQENDNEVKKHQCRCIDRCR